MVLRRKSHGSTISSASERILSVDASGLGWRSTGHTTLTPIITTRILTVLVRNQSSVSTIILLTTPREGGGTGFREFTSFQCFHPTGSQPFSILKLLIYDMLE